MARHAQPVRVLGNSGAYFHVGDVVRNAETRELMEVTVVDSTVIFFVRPRWYRRAWFWIRERI